MPKADKLALLHTSKSHKTAINANVRSIHKFGCITQ